MNRLYNYSCAQYRQFSLECAPEVWELRDPQKGCQIRKVPQNGYIFPMDFLQKGATMSQSLGPLPIAEVTL